MKYWRDGEFGELLDRNSDRVQRFDGIKTPMQNGDYLRVHGTKVHIFYHSDKKAYLTGRFGLDHLKKLISRSS